MQNIIHSLPTSDGESINPCASIQVSTGSSGILNPSSSSARPPCAGFQIHAACVSNQVTGAGAYTFKVGAGQKSFDFSDIYRRITTVDLNLTMLSTALSLTRNIPGLVTLFTAATPETEAISNGSLAKLAAADWRDAYGEFIEEIDVWECFNVDWSSFGPERVTFVHDETEIGQECLRQAAAVLKRRRVAEPKRGVPGNPRTSAVMVSGGVQ